MNITFESSSIDCGLLLEATIIIKVVFYRLRAAAGSIPPSTESSEYSMIFFGAEGTSSGLRGQLTCKNI